MLTKRDYGSLVSFTEFSEDLEQVQNTSKTNHFSIRKSINILNAVWLVLVIIFNNIIEHKDSDRNMRASLFSSDG